MAGTIDRWSADKRDELPDPGDTPRDRLRHTLAAHTHKADDVEAINATINVYGSGVSTGLTYGDLRAILNEIDR